MRTLRAAALCVLLAGCKDKNPTVVVVALSSEPKIPTEISRMEILVTRGGAEKFKQIYDLKAGHRLPGTLALEKDEDAKASDPITIKVSASTGPGKPWRVVREARLGFVEEKSKLLRLPLRYSCVGASSVCKDGDTCIGGVCRSAAVEVVALADYIETQKEVVQVPVASLKGPAAALAESLGCFPVDTCFTSVVDVPVSGASCSFNSPGPEGSFNVGMRWQQTPGRVAVLEQDPLEGYDLKDGRVVLSQGLCDALKERRALSVVVSKDCPTKQYEDPICDVEGEPVDESCNPQPEVCNGKDEDCDGIPDNDLEDEGVYCSAPGEGRCGAGLTVCEGGVPRCEPFTPVEEECNGLDDDCDGQIDETCVCEPGTESACYTGSEGTADVGACRSGVQLCKDDGTLDDCKGSVEPTAEICNGIDDDCNGQIDETCGCEPGSERVCYAGPPGSEGVGQCRAGTQACVDGIPGPCEGEVLPADEECNGVDDNCDGTVDEGCGCTLDAEQSCYTGPPGTEGVGQCRAGTQACIDGVLGPCDNTVTPVTEDCNGLDDDCDGIIDNGCEPGAEGGSGGVGGTDAGTGGDPGTGGDSGTGGDPGTGGDSGAGGDPGTGGDSGTGGDPGTGGDSGAGGDPGTGGDSGAGGDPGTGGDAGAGNAGGDAGAGGSDPGTGGDAGAGGCVAPMAECDQDPGTICETDTSTNEHCGACDQACIDPMVCVEGQCQ